MTSPLVDPETGLPIGRTVRVGPAERPGKDTRIEGERVILEAIDPDHHTDALHPDVSGPGTDALWLYLPDGPFPDLDTFRRRLARMTMSDDPLFLAIVDRETGAAIGHAAFMRMDTGHRVIEVGNILFSPRAQRTAHATEAMWLMARHAVETLGYRRYEWKCNALNAPSRAAALRLGFTYEGTFRDHMIVKGRSRDTAWFAMTQEDWPARAGAFRRWLAPENFDETGRQRLALSALNDPVLHAGSRGLRRAGPSDADALGALQEAAWARNAEILGVRPLPLETRPEAVIERYETWLADGPDGLAGALALDPRPDHLLVWSIAVSPADQGTGLGRDLLGAAETRARRLGLSDLRLYTGEKLTRNVAWYERSGYAIDRVEQLPDRRVVHMSKTIARGEG